MLSFSSMPPTGRTGAPDELTCSNGPCHSNQTDIEGTLDFIGFPAAAVSSQTFEVVFSITATAGNPMLAGILVTNLGEENGELVNVGTFSDLGSNLRILESSNPDRSYVGHFPAMGFNGTSTVNYTARWTTPGSFNTDTIKIYAAAVLADGTGGRTNDRVVTNVLSIPVPQTPDADMDGFNSDVDCDDNDPAINPGAEEIVNNDIDENCDGLIEEIDFDSDGFNSDEDCDDTDPFVNPGEIEIPNNDVDENCDGVVVINDEDMDGFFTEEDCNDQDPNINPGATEIPNNDVDEDCDGTAQQEDSDNDGFIFNVDCDDQNPNINPGALEIPGNGIDENCDGVDGMVSSSTSGRVLNILGNPVSNVTIIDNSDGAVITTTDSNGEFTIPSSFADTEIRMSKDAQAGDGITVSDLVVISNHILDRFPFTEVLQTSIADVNDNGSVSATDLVLIRNVILGNTDNFINRPVWNFDPPLIDLSTNNQTISITAYKLGDVNASSSTN